MSSPAPSQAPKRKVIKVAGEYFYLDFIDEVVEEIKTKAFFAQTGLGGVSKAEAFAYWILKRKGYFERQLSTDKTEEVKSRLADPIESTKEVKP